MRRKNTQKTEFLMVFYSKWANLLSKTDGQFNMQMTLKSPNQT